MRYYLYIADAKVDMLLPQVPGAYSNKIAAKLGFDVKVLSGSIETERTTLENRIARLDVVEGFILESEAIGTPLAPDRWIRGDVDATVVDIGKGAIMFVSRTEQSVLALGGSAHHLIGSIRGDEVRVGYSFLPTLIELLKEMDDRRYGFALFPDNKDPRYWTAGLGSGVEAWAAIIRESLFQATAPFQRITFLAKRLLVEKDQDGQMVILATPLYVALEN